MPGVAGSSPASSTTKSTSCTTGFSRAPRDSHRGLDPALDPRGVELPRDVLQIRGADDVVAVEDRPRLVSRDLHGDPLGYPGVDHVTHCRAPKVVPEHRGHIHRHGLPLAL